MAEHPKPEVIDNATRALAGIDTPRDNRGRERGSQSHTGRAEGHRYLQLVNQRESEAAATLREMRIGLDDRAKQDLIVQLSNEDPGEGGISQSDRASAMIDEYNELTTRGLESFDDPADRAHQADEVKKALTHSRIKAAILAQRPRDQEATVTFLVDSSAYRQGLDARLKDIASRDLTPDAAAITRRADNIARKVTALDEASQRRLAQLELIQEKIDEKTTTFLASEAYPKGDDGVHTPEQRAAAEVQARRELMAEEREHAGKFLPSDDDIDARAADYDDYDPDDVRLNKKALQAFTKEELFKKNQEQVITDLNDIHNHTVTTVLEGRRSVAEEVRREDLSDQVFQRKLIEINQILSMQGTDEPSSEVVIAQFTKLMQQGPEGFFRNSDPKLTDKAAIERLNSDFDAREEFTARIAKKIGEARLKVDKPPMTQDELNRLTRMLGDQGVEIIAEMFEDTQDYRDIRDAAIKGGMLDGNKWTERWEATKKSKGALTAALLGGILAVPGLPFAAGAALLAAAIGIPAMAFTYNRQNDIHRRKRYTAPSF